MIYYQPTGEVISLCRKFAKDCVETNADEYARRNQKNTAKIELDIFIGKIGEFAVYELLGLRTTSPVSKPDLQIYGKYKKSHDYDLSTKSNIKYSVKTQRITDIMRYGKSVLFQKNYIDSIKNKKQGSHFLVYCIFDEVSKKVEIHKILHFNEVLSMIDLPKIDRLKNNKYAIYLED